MGDFEKNSQNDIKFSEFAKGQIEKNKNIKLEKTSKKIDKETGVDWKDLNSKNLYDFKHFFGSFIVGICKGKGKEKDKDKINITHPHRLTTLSTHLAQGHYKMGENNYIEHPFKKFKVMTREQYILQYFNSFDSYKELITKLDYYLFKDIEILNGESILNYFSKIITPYLKEGIEIFENRKAIFLGDRETYIKYLEMIEKTKKF